MRKSELVHLFNRIGLKPSRRLGQNFLLDSNTIQLISNFIDPKGHECLIEIELDEPDAGVSSGIIWKFTVLDLMDELHQERVPLERIAEKTAPNSLVNSFENRNPRLGSLSQIKSD